MNPGTTSATLLGRLRSGEGDSAWRDFDGRYGDVILRFCCRSGLQLSDAEDVRQLVMLRLSTALLTFEYSPERGRFRNYLGRIVKNEIARKLGRPRASHERVMDLGEEVEAPSGLDGASDETWEREWMHYHLRLAMRRIRQTYELRSVQIFERLLEGDSVRQIAASFGLSEQAVHKIKQRIRDKLKRIIAGQVRAEEYLGG